MNLKEIIIKPDEKYVELKGVRPNLNQARMLKNLAADNKSETKATFQYLYQHYIIDAFEPEIARILEEMGIEVCGAPGTTAALALLNDAVKKGGEETIDIHEKRTFERSLLLQQAG